jgi:putative membrane protein
MALASLILTGLVATLHIYILALEMFLWRKPYGRRVFATTPEFADATAVLAANQGLYNGFLAAGLAWSLVAPAAYATALRLFFLGCVFVAGVYGGATAKRSILFVQGLPALVALGVTWLAR